MRIPLRLAASLVAWLTLAQGPAWAQTAVNKAAPIIPKSFGATALKPLSASTAPTGYSILSAPSKGILRVSGTQVTSANVPFAVSVANATTLTYDPDATATAGNYSFLYRTTNNATAAFFSLPVSNADCGQNSAIDFSERTVNENWKAQAGVIIGNTTVSTSKYASSVPGAQTNILEISNQPARLSTQGLVWQLNNQNVAGDNTATVELNFSRPVRNLAFSMEDIDISTLALGGSDFVDEVTFNAYTINGTTPYRLAAADVALGSNNSNRFIAGTNTIQGTTTNSGPDGTVVLTYPVAIAISRLEIIYRNTQTYTANNLRLQTIGIPSMVWCAEVDLVTTLTGPARVLTGQTVTYTAVTTNQGDISAAGIKSTVQLIPGLQNVSAPAGFSYNPGSGLLTLADIGTLAPDATNTSAITFIMPATGPVTGQAKSTTTGLDVEPDSNNGTQSNAQVTTVVNQAPEVRNVTAPTMSNTNGATAIPALAASDPDGDNTIASYLLTNIPNPNTGGQGRLQYTRNGANQNLANNSSVAIRTLTPAEMATLRFNPLGAFVGNATFTYTATDDLGLTSSTATYTIPVAPAAAGTTDLAVTQQVKLGPYLIGDQVTFTVSASNTGTDAAGVQVQDALPAGLAFVSATTFTGTYSSATGVWTIVSGAAIFASGTTATLTITATITRNGTFTNISTITSSTTDSNPLNNEASQVVNPSTAAYAQNFEGRTAPDYCEIYTGMALTTTNNVLADNTSLLSNVLSPTAASYVTPLLRMTGAATVSFLTRVTNITNTPRYRVALLNTAGGRTILTDFTAFADVNGTTITAPISQSGVYRIEVSFNVTTNNAGSGQAILDEIVINNATVATQAKDGTDCNANTPPVTSDVSFRIANDAAATTIPSLSGTDTTPGTVDSYVFQSVLDPVTQGSLTLNGVEVKIGQIITAAEAATLKFDPVAGYTGTATFQYRAIDNSNELSTTPATYTILVETNRPLPVELKAFEVKAAKADARLSWSTATEQDNDRFEVERSLNGTTFEKIGTVRGQGTTQTGTTYAFTDAGIGTTAQRLVYYRLRQVDTDGTVAYSPVRTVRFEVQTAAAQLRVFPNPAATATITLDLSALPQGAYQALLLDATGRTLGAYSVQGGGSKGIDVRTLPAGIYLVLVRGNGLKLSERLIKE